MKLGLVTYQIAAKWDCDRIIEMCSESGFDGVELRTTHAHGVEPSLSKSEREEVRKKFADSSVELYGLGTTVEYHSADGDELKRQIELSKEFSGFDAAALGIDPSMVLRRVEDRHRGYLSFHRENVFRE